MQNINRLEVECYYTDKLFSGDITKYIYLIFLYHNHRITTQCLSTCYKHVTFPYSSYWNALLYQKMQHILCQVHIPTVVDSLTFSKENIHIPELYYFLQKSS